MERTEFGELSLRAPDFGARNLLFRLSGEKQMPRSARHDNSIRVPLLRVSVANTRDILISTEDGCEFAAKDVLHRDLRLPDELPRLRKGCGDAHVRRLCEEHTSELQSLRH